MRAVKGRKQIGEYVCSSCAFLRLHNYLIYYSIYDQERNEKCCIPTTNGPLDVATITFIYVIVNFHYIKPCFYVIQKIRFVADFLLSFWRII